MQRLALWLLLACSRGEGEARAFVEALRLLPAQPERAWAACAELRDEELRGQCGLAVVEALAARRGGPPDELLLERCAALPRGRWRDECAFQLAERRELPEACARAGAFEDDCRLHLLSLRFARWVPLSARPADPALLARLREELRAVGLDPGDPRGASAYFRWVLGSRPRLDRSACLELGERALREACWQTGAALYADRLNRARDLGRLCGGEAPELEHAPDPELDALRRRWEEAACPP